MNLIKSKTEKVDDYFTRIKAEGYIPKEIYQNLDIKIIEKLLKKLDRYSDDMLDVIYCLSNNELPNLFSKLNSSIPISSGASVSHIGAYIGILIRGKNKLDREGRDYWIKPLVEIGILEPITLTNGTFVIGHTKAKSPNSSYRLSNEFINLIQTITDENFDSKVTEWINASNERNRLMITVNKNNSTINDNSHKQLIEDSINLYANHYLPNYICIFKDADNGDRITKEERYLLEKYKISFGHLDDVWPDVILYNPNDDSLWFIEAVTSDGEVDKHKLKGFKRICANSSKKFGGCTTTYFTFKRYYERQQSQNNISKNSHVWIKEFPENHIYMK